MSGIFHKFARFLSLWYLNRSHQYEPILAGLATGGAFAHLIYARNTKQKDTITIIDKYQIYQANGTQFVVHGKNWNGEEQHYVIPYSLWYWQFNVPEIWKRTQTGSTYKIEYYGYRVPVLAIFPNIISIRNIKD